MQRMFRRAINESLLVSIIYINQNQQFSQRTIAVHKMNDTHLIGYCFYRKQKRMFRLNNILAAELILKRVDYKLEQIK
ncbi:hypothetical protein AJ85_07940 [Alkalihalobacillus alcalophilus ATCC 27647 = CGMCC 1.3604]|uniref:WYL domain-containing protein n=1 Tax=Alkalihalobacillus alcalophilus ATCC 27647 = CGMCC 1.3604 TaxID=1218173 RepID=A0A094XAZ4_ALKAL|nr:hypothetical protein [Alkalihalobacillus alcalophilus]KGA95960.1 hypothetical protein BALCAV_0219130 [Alkalihalobacillus alcalophilus ATCC 27647 = CGMCC 1.3604]MED1563429.1 hypothetical protein [Alkalihalobacillus alcalophilus]THG90946.1 hypothetical protein AJ85_07940 [Alkalihalobacillus alcalophilus ATCC 27647 = CGMCC 1.3604]